MIHVAHASYSYVEPSGHEDEYQSLETGRIASRNMEVGMIFLLQTVAGILRNFSGHWLIKPYRLQVFGYF